MAKVETRGEAFHRELQAEYAHSGKTQREFAEERGLPTGTV